MVLGSEASRRLIEAANVVLIIAAGQSVDRTGPRKGLILLAIKSHSGQCRERIASQVPDLYRLIDISPISPVLG